MTWKESVAGQQFQLNDFWLPTCLIVMKSYGALVTARWCLGIMRFERQDRIRLNLMDGWPFRLLTIPREWEGAHTHKRIISEVHPKQESKEQRC